MARKLIFIGNSIVNGFPMSRGRSFPGLIRTAIKNGETDFKADVINKGNNGETTAQILDRFHHDVVDHAPAAVFIMTGTNDFIYREQDPTGCMANLRAMAEEARDHGIIPVYMTPIPVDEVKAARMWMAGIGVDYGSVNRQIKELAQEIRDSETLFIDTGYIWEGWVSQMGGDAYIDGVHPTPEGYGFLAGFILGWLKSHATDLGLKD